VRNKSDVIGYEAAAVYRLLTVSAGMHADMLAAGQAGAPPATAMGCGCAWPWWPAPAAVNPEPCPALYCPVLPLQDGAYLAEWTYGTDFQFLCLGSRSVVCLAWAAADTPPDPSQPY
jgi:hypothetical protein